MDENLNINVEAGNTKGSHEGRGTYPSPETGQGDPNGPLAELDPNEDPSLRDRDMTDSELEIGGQGDDARGGSSALGSDPTEPPPASYPESGTANSLGSDTDTGSGPGL